MLFRLIATLLLTFSSVLYEVKTFFLKPLKKIRVGDYVLFVDLGRNTDLYPENDINLKMFLREYLNKFSQTEAEDLEVSNYRVFHI